MAYSNVDELSKEFGRRYRAGERWNSIRIFEGDEHKDTPTPGGRRMKWIALADRVFKLCPNWHRIELLDARKPPQVVSAPIVRDVGEAIGLPEDLAEIASEAAKGTGVNAGQQLASFAGLLQLVTTTVKTLREGDREMLKAVLDPAIKTMQIYADRVEAMEKAASKMSELQYALARKQGMLEARAARGGDGEGVDPADDAMMGFLERAWEWFEGRKKGAAPPPGSNGAAHG
jgi:hypothetical protein